MTFEEWWADHTKGVTADEMTTPEYNSYLDQKVAALHAWEAGIKEGEKESEKNVEWAKTSQRAVAALENVINQLFAGLNYIELRNASVELHYMHDSTAVHAYTLLEVTHQDLKIKRETKLKPNPPPKAP
jgi:hypothetical protein